MTITKQKQTEGKLENRRNRRLEQALQKTRNMCIQYAHEKVLDLFSHQKKQNKTTRMAKNEKTDNS